MAQEKTLTLHLNQRPLQEILTQLEAEADVSFAYESTLLDDLPLYTLNVEQQPLSECLVISYGCFRKKMYQTFAQGLLLYI